MRRTPLKRGTYQLKKTPLKKRSEKTILESRNKDTSEWDLDRAFYSQIWSSRKHYCYESNAFLGNEPLTVFFHHVLPKAEYPQYRHKEWNIVLLTWEMHDQWDLDKEKCPKVHKYYLELLEKHNTFE